MRKLRAIKVELLKLLPMRTAISHKKLFRFFSLAECDLIYAIFDSNTKIEWKILLQVALILGHR